MTVEELDVTVEPGGTSAAATLVVRSDDRFEELQLRLVKPADDWLVHHAERLAALERPALAR